MNKFLLFLFTSVLISCTEKKTEAQNQNKFNVISELTKIESGKDAHIGLAVTGIEDDFAFDSNRDEKLPTLSVYKFHIALAVLNWVDEGKISLEKEIFITKKDLLTETWSPIREKYPQGNINLPLSEIIKYTVADSDNDGCDILLNLIGGPETVQNFMNEKGVKNFQIKNNEADMTEENMKENFSSTGSVALLLKNFYQNKIISKSSTDFLMKVMLETTTGENKIKAGLPKGTALAHKTGASGKNKEGITTAENDMGIVTLPNGKHYAICIFVTNSKESQEVNEKMIADLSKLAYDYALTK